MPVLSPYVTYWIGRVDEDPFSWVLVLGKDTKKNLRSYTWGKNSLLKKEQKGHIKREVGQAKRGTGAGMVMYGVFKTGLLHTHLGGRGQSSLTVASYIATDYVAHVFPIIQSVIIIWINV